MLSNTLVKCFGKETLGWTKSYVQRNWAQKVAYGDVRKLCPPLLIASIAFGDNMMTVVVLLHRVNGDLASAPLVPHS